MRTDIVELITEVQEADRQSEMPLGTAQWMRTSEASARLAMRPDVPSSRIWLGETCDHPGIPLGYADDRHVCLVSGTRGGKGTGLIVPTLCLWPGSALIIDPKGENATVTARRRGHGSEYARGLGQEVRILDPFGEVQLDPALKARFNPLDVIDPLGDYAIDDAGRIAASIIVRENHNDPFFEEAARNLLKGLILHVLSSSIFEGIRNLVTVRRLATQGDWLRVALLREAGETSIPSGFTMLWKDMQRSEAFGGVVAGVGEQMLSMAEKTRSGVLETLRTNTTFLDGTPMQRLLETSDFDLAALKTNPLGLTVYLTLPQRYMETHFRWLRLMVSLAVGEMERIKGRPKTDCPTLFLLDEFAGLKRMEVIENAVAQAAGFGVKFFFILQNLPQLKREYDDNWESFVSNSGLKVFFQIDDHFTRDYLSHLLGEREVRRESRSGSQSWSDSTSNTVGTSTTNTAGTSDSRSRGGSSGTSRTGGLLGFLQAPQHQRGRNNSNSWSSSQSHATGSSVSTSGSRSDSGSDGWNEGIHKRSLLNPDEIGRFLSRIDDRFHPAFPGLLVAVMPGQHPLVARRVNYFQSAHFAGLFDPHPNHPRPPTLIELSQRIDESAFEIRRPPLLDKTKSRSSVLIYHFAYYLTFGLIKTGRAVRTGAKFIVGGMGALFLLMMFVGAIGSYLDRKSGVESPQSQGAASTTAARPAQPAQLPPAQSLAFQQGAEARRIWENWVISLGRDARAGVDFWAGERGKPNPGSCSDGPGQWSAAFRDACLGAKQYLTPTDVRRLNEPDFKRGWNIY
jgi:type IV secretory pathway TraG/TraD family ATPase VirD4